MKTNNEVLFDKGEGDDALAEWSSRLTMASPDMFLRSSMLILAIGGNARKVMRFQLLMEMAGAELGPEEADVAYLVFDTSSTDPTLGYYAPHLLSEVMDRLKIHAKERMELKIGVSFGRGILSRSGPMGPMLDEAIVLSEAAKVGVLNISNETQRILKKCGKGWRSLSDSLRGWWKDVSVVLSHFSFRAQVFSAGSLGEGDRCRDAAGPNRPGHKDLPLGRQHSWVLSWEVPSDWYAQLLVQHDGRILIRGPLSEAAQRRQNLIVTPSTFGGLQRPLLLLSDSPLSNLKKRVEQVNQLMDLEADERVQSLFCSLGEDQKIVLLDGDSFQCSEVDDPFREAKTRIAGNDNVGALSLLETHIATGAESMLTAFQMEAGYLYAQCLRRTGAFVEAKATLLGLLSKTELEFHGDIQGDVLRELAILGLFSGELRKSEVMDCALKRLERALECHRQAGSAGGLAKDYLAMANIDALFFEGSQAIELYQKAVDSALGAVDSKVRSAAMFGLGVVMDDLGMLREAETTLEAARELCLEIDDYRNLPGVDGALAILKARKGEYSAALFHGKSQLEQLTLRERWAVIPRCLLSLSHMEMLKGDAVESRRHLNAYDALKTGTASKAYRALRLIFDAETALLEAHFYRARVCLWFLDPSDEALSPEVRRRSALCLARYRERLGQGGVEEAYHLGIQVLEGVRERTSVGAREHLLNLSRDIWDGWISQRALRGAAWETLEAIERSRAQGVLDGLHQTHSISADLLQVDMPALKQQSFQTPLWSLHILPDRVLSVWVHRGEAYLYHLQVSRDALDGVCTLLRKCCEQPGMQAAAERTAKLLSEYILEDIEPHLSALDPETILYVSMPGVLRGIPLEVLPVGKESQPLVQKVALSYVPSLSAVSAWASADIEGEGSLILADAEGDLPGARREGEHLSQVLPGSTLYLGCEANLSALFSYPQALMNLHIACHAKSGTPGELLLAPDGSNLSEKEHDKGWHVARKTGRLSAPFLAKEGPRARRVFLAACGSGRGGVTQSGEGPDLLSYAFLRRGARSVISTLWPISDQHSSRLSPLYYDHLMQGIPPVLALAMTKRHFLKLESSVNEKVGSDEKRSKIIASDFYVWSGFCTSGVGD